jgi:periplasmic copper chaperone A
MEPTNDGRAVTRLLPRPILLLLPALALVLTACAGGEPDVEVGAARAGVPAGGASQIVVEVTNTGDGDDELVRASSPAAAAVELHRTEIEDGRATMTELDGVAIPAGETIAFRPGGLHLMMVLPDESVAEGGTFPLTLHFDRSGERTVEVEVVPIAQLVDDTPAE